MFIAITREVSSSLERCELSHIERSTIDVEKARAQHRAYERCLAAAQCEIRRLPEDKRLPDSVFIEDTAVVLDEVAVITRPGAESRRPETASAAKALETYRRLEYIREGTLDGGDVLKADKTLYVGLSGRTSKQGLKQFRNILAPFGYAIEGVPVEGCLHLKSAVTKVAENTLLINGAWVDERRFKGMKRIEVNPLEPLAANALLIGKSLIYAMAFPRTRERLEKHGIQVMPVDVSELAKAEGGVTCCSLIIRI